MSSAGQPNPQLQDLGAACWPNGVTLGLGLPGPLVSASPEAGLYFHLSEPVMAATWLVPEMPSRCLSSHPGAEHVHPPGPKSYTLFYKGTVTVMCSIGWNRVLELCHGGIRCLSLSFSHLPLYLYLLTALFL